MSKIEEVKLINPITGLPVDEIITEDEATKRGYFEYEFLLRYLEDDNEFIKYFVVDGKKIVVDLKKPYLQYRKPTQINHERVHNTEPEIIVVARPVELAVQACSIDNPDCESCGA